MPVSETLPTSTKTECATCARPMPHAKRGAGKPKLYCSNACKSAAWRVAHGQDTPYYEQVSNVSDTPLCARCPFPAEKGKRGYKMYCSPACKQKAVRERDSDTSTKPVGPTAQVVSETLPSGSPETPKPKRPRRKVKPEDELIYWRKGKGVAHVGVERIVAFCGKATEGMGIVDGAGEAKLCQRCQHTRDNTDWWHNWRALHPDEDWSFAA